MDEAIQLFPDDTYVRRTSALVLNKQAWTLATDPDSKRWDAVNAITFAERAVELSPGEGFIWNTLGVARYRADQWHEAIEALEKSISLQGDNSLDWFFLAMAHQRLGHEEEARRWYDQAVEWMKKHNPDIWN